MTSWSVPRSILDAENNVGEFDSRAAEELALAHRPEHGGPILSIIVPTFNERDNVRPLVNELSRVLAGQCAVRSEPHFVRTPACAPRLPCHRASRHR